MELLTEDKILFLRDMAATVREDILSMLIAAGSGHTAGPLGMSDVFTLLYFHALKHRPKEPLWEQRDRVVLSNGHICPVQYAVMARSGYFPVEELSTLRKLHSRLQGHPHREYLPGVEVSSGPLGNGLPQAVGMALAERIDYGHTSQKFFYCMMGDGELNEGIVWEAAMLAGREGLHNLIIIIDRNDIQIDGYTHDVMPLEPLGSKWAAFNWHVQEADGHNFVDMYTALSRAHAVSHQPSVIIARTVPGKGVPAYERDYRLHGYFSNKDEAKEHLQNLRTLHGRIASEHE
jgi:transketolase